MEYSFLQKIAGNFKKNPDKARLGWEAEMLIEKAIEDIGPGRYLDCHVHLAGLGTGQSGCWVNPKMFNWLYLPDRIKIMTFINSSGIDDLDKADQQYVTRLNRLIDDFPLKGKFMLLALDMCYDKDGKANKQDTKLYIPNDFMYEVYQSDPDRFIPCISVHPYRRDAVSELEKWAKKGVKAVKWIPNEMGIDPSDELCEPFYAKMREYDMVLLGHTGRESAVEVMKFKPLGNPLLYRKPLDMGVKVIMAHCASLGTNLDIDKSIPVPAKNYKLFLRLMDEAKYEGLLFGDISAIVQINRMGAPLRTMLKRTDLHHRLLQGTDYPLPAINASVSLKAMALLGYLNAREEKALRQIYKRNPLLFDFVLKRCLKDPLNQQNKFAAEIFEQKSILIPASSPKESGQALGQQDRKPQNKSVSTQRV